MGKNFRFWDFRFRIRFKTFWIDSDEKKFWPKVLKLVSAGARFSLPRLSELGDCLTIFYLIGSRRKPVSISAKERLNPKKIFFGLQNFQYSNKQYSPILCYDLLVVTSRRTNMRNLWHCVTASTIWLYQKIPKSSELSTDMKKIFFLRFSS